jgi:hypothetical protein
MLNDPFYPCERETIVDLIFIFLIILLFILSIINNLILYK